MPGYHHASPFGTGVLGRAFPRPKAFMPGYHRDVPARNASRSDAGAAYGTTMALEILRMCEHLWKRQARVSPTLNSGEKS
jgi:hypothetical protein